MQFNEQQLALINAPLDQKVVGISAAGTGKTTTMLGRTARILKEYSTGNVLLISFTRDAAQDLRNKLVRSLGEDHMRRVQVGTFHSIIANCIRKQATAVGLEPTFSIIDENSANMMYQSILESHNEWLDSLLAWSAEFHDGNKPKKLTKRDYNKMTGIISTVINTSLPEELETGQFKAETLERLQQQVAIPEYIFDEILGIIYKAFIESLNLGRINNVVTYDHILFIGHLMAKAGMLETYSQSLAHMIVDEYQDTNALQDSFVRVVGKSKLTIIGDLDQSIYEFRGGRIELMEKHADEGIVINLTYNYRSYQPILDIANNLIAHNETGSKYRKPLESKIPMDQNYGGITYVASSSDRTESQYIIDRITYLTRQGVKPKDIAILVRSRMAVVDIKKQLQIEKIEVNDRTKFADFMNSDVMVDTLNFIKVFTNPKDVYAFMSVIDKPKRGLGPKAIQTLETNAKNLKMGIIEYLLSEHIQDLTPGMRKKVEGFVKVYETITDKDITMSLSEAVNFLLEDTGYIQWFSALKNAEKHKSNLEILRNYVMEFEEEYKKDHQQYSLHDIANAFTFEAASASKNDDADGVVISTSHGSKGLEWDYVFLIGMEQAIFPGERRDLDIESERRLAYVSFTRAKRALILCSTDSRITLQSSFGLQPSQFLKEAGIARPNIRL